MRILSKAYKSVLAISSEKGREIPFVLKQITILTDLKYQFDDLHCAYCDAPLTEKDEAAFKPSHFNKTCKKHYKEALYFDIDVIRPSPQLKFWAALKEYINSKEEEK